MRICESKIVIVDSRKIVLRSISNRNIIKMVCYCYEKIVTEEVYGIYSGENKRKTNS